MDEAMEDGSNMLVMPGSRKKKAHRKTQPAARNISKSMQRKLKRLEEEKEKKKLRKQALGTLAEHKLADGADQLMLSSSTLGKAKTMREKLRWGLQLERAGLPVPSDIPLRREKPSFEEEPDEMDFHAEHVDDTKRKCDAEPLKPDAKRQKKEVLAQAKTVNTDLALPLDGSIMLRSRAFATEAKSKKPKQIQVKTCNNTGLFDNPRKFVVHVARSEDIEEQRSNLPVVMMEQEIMEAVNENDVVIICGETGSGKTTQVPQFLYEDGYGSPLTKDRSGMIGVTQPRRIAVLTTAKRVAFEMNLQLGKEVGFQVRHDRRIGERSCMKFMTDGILLREIQSDFLLRKYSVIVLDEAHERSVNTDILVGMLSRVVPMRKKMHDEYVNKKKKNKADDVITPLKLIVMSATLRVEDFTANEKLFPTPPPVVNVAARQFPVTIHSSRKTELLDYQGAAYKKVCAIHRKLPPGGILVFMTGRREVEALCRRLRSAFSSDEKSKSVPAERSEDHDRSLISGSEFGSLDIITLQNAVDVDEDGEESDFDYDKAVELEGEDITGSESEVSDIEETEQQGSSQGGEGATALERKKPGPLYVLPLYAMLPAAAQLRVFSAVPEGRRLVVVATNVAETSVTIPGIRYVVDCGRAKEKKFSGSSGLSKFEISWISKASADQRAGRAGRTGPGHCYQLYSRTHYHNNFSDFSPPEISLIPIEGVALVLKCMGIDKVMQFPFPTPPEQAALVDAEKCLLALGALDRATNKPTPTGKSMALYPVNPRHARMLIEALESADSRSGKSMRKQVIVACAVAMAAALSVDNPFLDDGDKEENPQLTSDDVNNKKKLQLKQLGPRAAHAKFLNPSSDALTIVNALSAYEQSKKPCEFCKENYLNEKIMKEMVQLRRQLSRIVRKFEDNNKDALVQHEEAWKQFSQTKLKPAEEAVLLRALCAGWPDRIAKRLKARDKLNWQTNSKRGIRYQASSFDQTVFLRPSSSTFKFASDFVVYKEIVQTATRPYMSSVALVDASCLVSKASYFCTFSKPLDDPAPFYDSEKDQVMCWVSVTFGPYLWQLPLQRLPMKAGKQRTGTFAFALMAGKVFPGFVNLRPLLAMEPSMLLRPEAVAHKRVGDLVYRLESSGIDCRSKLAEMWKQDPGFLYVEVLAWLQRKHQGQLELIWDAVKATAGRQFECSP